MKYIPQISVVFLFTLLFSQCNNKEHDHSNTNKSYLNLGDSAHYVGVNTCKQCHYNVYKTYQKTGMGQSFDHATQQKSAAFFAKHVVVYDSMLDFYYHPFWQNDSLYIKEYRLEEKDTVYQRIEKVNYIIGSGQHTNSHLIERNGYIYQAPITFYTQKQKWSLAPGFDNGHSSRFSRKIGLECMSCHNGLPDFEFQSENKYHQVLVGIDCERCHGPGSVHVSAKQQGDIIDTSKYIDYTIVNPKDLSVDQQMSLCQRCHLQGIAVLNEGKNFDDFKPGMLLSTVMNVFIPKYKGESDFIMASHADRLKMSKCFQSKKMSCITCHNPHVSVKETTAQIFNQKCQSCHSTHTCSANSDFIQSMDNNCIQCHMPKSGSIDIPHVNITDHYIQVPETEKKIVSDTTKEFLNLFCMTSDNVSSLTIAKGYINFYEKYTSSVAFLDSAQHYVNQAKNEMGYLKVLIHLSYLKNDFNAITHLSSQDKFTDGWTNYRIGEAYYQLGDFASAEKYFLQATQIKPYILDFQNKLGITYLKQQRWQLAKSTFQFILKEQPDHAVAHCNIGFVYLNLSQPQKAMYHYDRSIALDPDYEQALLNKVGIYLIQQKTNLAKPLLKKILNKNPNNQQALYILQHLTKS